jgi:hypothetical protein
MVVLESKSLRRWRGESRKEPRITEQNREGRHQGNIHSAQFPLFFVVLGLELRAFTLSHSTSPFL